MSAPLVSVLITAFNREEFIGEAIESVLESSYANFEIIIVDDCSNDRTLEVANHYAQQDFRIKVYRNEKNLTQFVNRNKAASLATGKYIKYVDSDDIIYPYTLEVMVDGMERFPTAGLGFCLIHGTIRNPFPYIIDQKDAYEQHFFKGGLLFVGPSGIIIKREAFEAVKGFEEFGMPSDSHFSLKIAGKYPVVAMAKDLFWWRQHDEQVFHQNKKNDYNILNNYHYTKDIILKHSPLTEEVNRKILFNLKKNFLRHIFRLVFKKGKPTLAVSLLQNARRKR
jgi:glycosyltransferase involved in cell wall biosynthesis